MNEIAIIMSVYHGDTLNGFKSCIESIYNQKGIKFDTCIGIDGKIDAELNRYLYTEQKRGKIKIIVAREENKGLAITLNEMIRKCTLQGYKFLCRMDADDFMMPYRIEHQHSIFLKNPDLMLVGGSILEDDGHTKRKLSYPGSLEDIESFSIKRSPFAHMTVMFRSEFFNIAGLYPTDNIRNEDYALWINAIRNKVPMRNVCEVYCVVRANSELRSRRLGFNKIVNDAKFRVTAGIATGKFFSSLFYAFSYLAIMLAPSFVRNIAYNKLR